MHRATAATATRTPQHWGAGLPTQPLAPISFLNLSAPRRMLARTSLARLPRWGGEEEVRRTTGVVLGCTTGATGAAPAARRHMWLRVAWTVSAARGSTRSRMQQWLRLARERPDTLRRPPSLVLDVAVILMPPSRRREEMPSLLLPSPPLTSPGMGEAGRRTSEENKVRGGWIVA